MTTRVTQARQKMVNTQREADAAAAALKQATGKLEAAREALKKEPEKKELTDGVTAAEQAATAAAAKMDLKGKKVAAMVSGRNLTAEHLRLILSGGVPKP